MRNAPFVLLDDARTGTARLYIAPSRIVEAHTIDAVVPALETLRAAREAGLYAAGYLTYEAGAAFVDGVAMPAGSGPLLWFGLFETFETVDDVGALLPDPAGAWAGAPVPDSTRQDYDARIAEVLDLIAAGDIYQANLTLSATVPHAGDPLALYARLRGQAHAGHAALVDTGSLRLLSLSPESFFTLDGDALVCRPMKGTTRRIDGEDGAAALAADPKQRAENLMIVDLMRNDLARVAVPGSVAVPDLFAVESYPSVHQMVSTVTARLASGLDACDVIAALFPCGSITGAPKRRAMQVIADIERRARGAYCGAIGRIDADGSADFNVAIRTLELRDGHATLGIGGGIVADSRADAEWDEAVAKADFVTAGAGRFDLIETMAFDPEAGLAHLERHIARLRASAEALGFVFDRHAARNELQAATFRLRRPARVRMLLAPSGAVAIEVAPLPVPATEPVSVAVVPLPVPAADIRLRHKTSDRGFYDAARIAAGTFEVAFEAAGMLTEGSFTSLFVPRGDVLVTPPLARGLLPGVLRGRLIDEGRAVEGDVTADDLDAGFFIGNAVRGLIPAIRAVAP